MKQKIQEKNLSKKDEKVILSRTKAIKQLWERGILYWKLHEGQKELYEEIKKIVFEKKGRRYVLNIARRYGKSFLLCLIAIEYALRNPGSQIGYAAPTAKHVRKIIKPIFRQILQDCPDELKPKWNSTEGAYMFNNGSLIFVAGVNNGHEDDLRGADLHLGIIDEGGFVDNLEYLIDSAMHWMTLKTKGAIILSSTPPVSPAHDYVKYAREAEKKGYYAHRTIYQNPTLTPEEIKEEIELAGGEDTTTWKRECLAQFITDSTLSIIPEFTDEKKELLVKELPRPVHFDSYVAMDVGFNDLTVVLFGYWDFERACLVIEDELVLEKMTTQMLADGIKEKERALWGSKKPYRRVSDTDLIVIGDLSNIYDIGFLGTQKDNKEAAIANVRTLFTHNKIYINPRCKVLIDHLRHGIWNKQRTSFDRSGKFGHFDAIDALVYLCRNIDRNRNPLPPLPEGVNSSTHYIPPYAQNNPQKAVLKKLFGNKNSKF